MIIIFHRQKSQNLISAANSDDGQRVYVRQGRLRRRQDEGEDRPSRRARVQGRHVRQPRHRHAHDGLQLHPGRHDRSPSVGKRNSWAWSVSDERRGEKRLS